MAIIVTIIGNKEHAGSSGWFLTVLYFTGLVGYLSLGKLVRLFTCLKKIAKSIPNKDAYVCTMVEIFEDYILEYRPGICRKIFWDNISVAQFQNNNALHISSRLSSDLQPFYKSKKFVATYFIDIPLNCMEPYVFEGICQLLRDKGKAVSGV